MPHNDILSKAARQSGMTVPDGYFADFQKRMEASLPEMPWEKQTPKVMPRTFWQKTRPYIYMAAMLLGVWCMMKMFDFMRPSSSNMTIETNPGITAAINNDAFFNDYVVPTLDDSALLDDLYEEGFEASDFN